MAGLTPPELEKKNKNKEYYNEFKKWSFEDYEGYLEKKKKGIKNRLIIVLFLLVAFYISFAMMIVTIVDLDEARDKVELREQVLIKEAEKKCAEINQTFMYSQILQYKKSLLVHCSENNLVIGDYEID